MPNPSLDLHTFSVAALRADGSPVTGATLRVVDGAGLDMTAVLLGSVSPVTDASGLVTRFFSGSGPLPTGKTYTLHIAADGFDPWSYSPYTGWQGAGLYQAELSPAGSSVGDYTLTQTPPYYASAMYPILASVDSTLSAPWELIRYHVTHLDGRTSILEVPVDPQASTATADLHSRARLHVLPHLVPDTDTYLADPNFSDELSISLESMTRESTSAIDIDFTVGVANMVPDGDTNSLENYSTGRNGGDGLQKWITLFTEPIVFRGYYFDTMIWLVGVGVDYTLHIQNQDSAGNSLGTALTETIPGNKRVLRIRLDANPDADVRKAKLWVTQGGITITDYLTVHYRG